jgi:DNA-binding PadR family transcriptional regulator
MEVDMSDARVVRYLPLSETTYYILLALTEPRHGYAIMQHTAELSDGRIKMGPGTLYGAITKLLKEAIIIPYAISVKGDNERRKTYMLTDLGRQVLQAEYERLQEIVSHGATLIKSWKSKEKS